MAWRKFKHDEKVYFNGEEYRVKHGHNLGKNGQDGPWLYDLESVKPMPYRMLHVNESDLMNEFEYQMSQLQKQFAKSCGVPPSTYATPQSEHSVNVSMDYANGMVKAKPKSQCECGAHSLKSERHSTWCKLFRV